MLQNSFSFSGFYVSSCPSRAPEIDMSELESLFAAVAPKSDQGKSREKLNSRAPAKFDRVQLVTNT